MADNAGRAWATPDVMKHMLAAIDAAQMYPAGVYPSMIEGIWQAETYGRAERVRGWWESAGFIVVGTEQDYIDDSPYTYVRFRLPTGSDSMRAAAAELHERTDRLAAYQEALAEAHSISDGHENDAHNRRAEVDTLKAQLASSQAALEAITMSDFATGTACEWCGGIRWTAQGDSPDIDHVPNCPVRIAQVALAALTVAPADDDGDAMAASK